jgi:hypothetical protein
MLKEEYKLRVSEMRVLGRIFGPKREEVTQAGENCIKRMSVIWTLHPLLLG